MDPTSQNINILIVGSDGRLGSNIVDRCLEMQNLKVNILCQQPQTCNDLCQRVANSGGKCVKADLTKPETLKGLCKDIHTIISAVEGDEDVLLEGQEALLREAIDCKVKRFVPSDFTLDYRNINVEDHPKLKPKLQLRKKIASSSVKGLHIFCGVFYEKIFKLYNAGIVFWETMDQKIALTAQDDVARFTAAAVAQPQLVGDICVAGDQLSLREIMDLYNGIRNVKIPVTKMGNLSDLRNAIQTAKSKGDMKRSSMLNYILLMTEGKASFTELNNNRFPIVNPIHFDQYIKNNPDKKLGDQGKEGMEKQPVENIFSDLMPQQVINK